MSKKDVRLGIETTLEEDIAYFSVRKQELDVYGLCDYSSSPVFRRVPEDIAVAVTQESGYSGVEYLSKYTAGARVRFATNSPYISIKVIMPVVEKAYHTSPLNAGFILYEDLPNGESKYITWYGAEYGTEGGYEMIRRFCADEFTDSLRYYTLYFPTFSSVSDCYIGIKPQAEMQSGKKYQGDKPIYVYGSSIVHGQCADNGSNCYPSIMSRILNRDVINLGFSGNAHGETVLAKWIASLPMSAFVYDYDHNAPTLEFLENTHNKFYQIIREKHPEIPVIFMTRPIFRNDDLEMLKRRAVVYNNFLQAKERGENVWFIDGESLLGFEGRDEATSDFVHPNTFGYYQMAKGVSYFLRKYCGF